MSSKRNSTHEDTVPIHILLHQKHVIFIDIHNPTLAESAVATKHNNIHTKSNIEIPTYTRERSVIGDRRDNGRGGY